MRRFPSTLNTELGFEGSPTYIFCVGVVGLIGLAVAARYITEDTTIEKSKRHHPKGLGYTTINQQKDKLRDITKKVQPNIDENYYEYSRHNPKRHR